MADDNKKPVGFTLAQAKRIAQVVKRSEQSYRNPPPTQSRYPIGGFDGGQVAKVKTTIQPRSGQTAGTGTVTFQVLGEDGIYIDGETDVPVKNPYATSLSVGTWVTLVPASGGLTVFGANC